MFLRSRIKYNQNDIWLDIACNDGTLLKQIPNKFNKLGIDPCDDSFYKEASQYGTIIQDYFSYDAYQKTGYGDQKAKVITTIAMFYDLDDPNPFIEDIIKILDDNGIWVTDKTLLPDYVADFIQNWLEDNIKPEIIESGIKTGESFKNKEQFETSVLKHFSGYLTQRADAFEMQLNQIQK